MTVAALALDQTLSEIRNTGSLDGVARRFQRAMAKGITASWLMATSEDCRMPLDCLDSQAA
jgi:hypothetical protein